MRLSSRPDEQPADEHRDRRQVPLNRAIWMTLLVLCSGLLLGGTVTRYYDCKEFRRASTTRHTP
ncbi:hypothetical protein [Nocardia sp. NPDC004604]|uniref:hypothetical protein n=1 Tax=Nocardia sp. NPDC004604 TaxID=3157013 RepID=UPI0033AD4A49